MRNLSVTCDICKEPCKAGEIGSSYLYMELAIGANRQLQPIPKQDDYCASCADKVKKYIDTLKEPSHK